jgi:uncharacterized repeat protein (TIGR01451 family)
MRYVRLAVLASLGTMAVAIAAPAAWADRAFSPRFATNDTGDIVMAANTLLSCQEGAAGCADARAGRTGAKLGNNSWDMRFVDVDSDSATFNSSRADVVLPADASILFAGLYWGANTTAGASGGSAAPDANAKNSVRFATPTSGYVTVTADRVDEGAARSQLGAYQAFADVTALVSAGGAGTYTTANVQAGRGLDRYAGWSLVVAYHSPTAPPRNLTVFDGFVTVNSGDPPQQISVSGFRTPPSGPVRSKLGFVAYEGDLSLGGDKAFLNGRALTDGVSGSATNFFNSAITNLGQPVTSKAPDYRNQLGYEADVSNAEAYLRNGETSATLKLETTGDTYLPGVVWIATELFAPDVQSTKTVTDLNGGLVEPGDELEYVVAGANRGQDAAANAVVTDAVPANTTFVPGSLQVTGGAGPRSDAAGDDAAEFDAGAGQVLFRVGADAGVAAGGRLAPNDSYEARYRVRVAAGTPSGTAIVNQARVSYLAETLGFPVEKATNETRLTTSAPDLAIQKQFSGSVLPNTTVTYTINVTNVGDAPSRGEVVVSDPLPGEISFFPPTGAGWACVQTPALEISCRRSDSLAPGASYPPIVISGLTFPVLTQPFVNTSTVSGGGDVNESNNSSTAQPPPPAFVSLGLEKEVTPDTVAPGEEVTYMLRVMNRSAFAADGVQLNDPLPPGLTLVSAEPLDQGTCDAAVSCALGALPGGGSARVRIRATVGAQVGPGEVPNTATVTASLPDDNPSDNTDSGSFRVRRTARLEMSKRLEGTPRAGRPVRWTVTVQNAGPHASVGADFVDLLPEVVENATATVAGGSCHTAGRTLSCGLPEIAAGGRAEVSISGTLGSNAAAGQLLNGVQIQPGGFRSTPRPPSRFAAPVSPAPPLPPAAAVPPGTPGSPGPLGPLAPPPPGGASTPPGVVIEPAADVGVAKVATPDPLARNGTARWHVRTTNHGPSTATNLTIRDTLPAGARFVRANGAGRCRVRGRVVTCRFGDLRARRSVETEIVARLGRGGNADTLRNSIVTDAAQPDPVASNNRDRSSSPLAPRLTLQKTVNARIASMGDRLRYTLRLGNRGPGTARNIRLCDRPGRGLALSRAPGGRVRGRSACWTIGRLARGRSVVRSVVARVVSNGRPSLRNVATVRTGGTRVARAARSVRVLVGRPPGVTG